MLFLLENNVYYFDIIDVEMDEVCFFNVLCYQCGCGLLFDLYNVYINVVNYGFDVFVFVDEFDLCQVGEIYVVDGMMFDGFYFDVYSGVVVDLVWVLFEYVFFCCFNVGVVVFEFFGFWFEVVGEECVCVDLCCFK